MCRLLNSLIYCIVLTTLRNCVFANIYNNEVSINNQLEDDCNLPAAVVEEIAAYANVTDRIIQYFTSGPYRGQTWQSLADFVDKFGNRLAGTKNLENSIDYMVKLLSKNDLEQVHTEEVEVPFWSRGKESATLLEPRVKKMSILGLGYSVGTPPEGVTGEVVVVQSFDELQKVPAENVQGKIVVYAESFISYGDTVEYRSRGASEAAKKGAIAALVRSITPFSLATPHTGMQSYSPNITKIPVAAITLEDADELLRMYKKNMKIVIKLVMSATLETKISRNTIAELTGSKLANKIVVVSGHLDSWDVGEGAMDDGGGAFISWIAPVVLKKLNLRPRRTLRAILWTAEEFGYVGARAYEKNHRKENDNLNFVMESDIGTFTPLGLTYKGSKTGECMMREIAKLFSSINATQIVRGDPGSDIVVWTSQGVPGGELLNANEKYFWYHHTEADRMNVLDSDTLDKCAAYWAAFSYIVADLTNDIPRS